MQAVVKSSGSSTIVRQPRLEVVTRPARTAPPCHTRPCLPAEPMHPRRHPLLVAAALAGVLSGLKTGQAFAQHTSGGPQKALFDTQAEAEAAARHFNCTGAHRMGNQWMPCASHGEASGGHGTLTPMGH